MPCQTATSEEQPNQLLWEEEQDSLVIRFPLPVGEGGNIPLWMALTLVSMLALISLFWLLTTFIYEARVSVAKELSFVALLGLMVWLWPKVFRTARRSVHAPQRSMLIIREGILTLQRAGRNGDFDVSWCLDEVTDIRVCATYEVERMLLESVLSIVSLLFMTGKKTLVRISVMLPSGEVQDAVFPSIHGAWIDQCENRLRAYLNLVDYPEEKL